ncbi:MFS transporter [Anaeroselena agilis]|uniref:MFS transporter n=1 Tax=Anaeroselena agilis TaxID=3063788 RepID=A0ABU3P1L8_9FIRM|nr:MFS transporter [Selenomonadales bacterium 4137-cl]
MTQPRKQLNPWLIFGVTSIGTFMATLDASIINVALPRVASQLNVNLPLVQWVVSAYLLTISCLLPLFGRLGDIFSRRLVCNAGFFVFTLGSMLCGLSGHIALLIAARVVQAVGAAMLMANAPAIVAAAFPGPGRGRALGMVGMVVALGSMTGPSVGGLLVGAFGWESIFFVNLPIGAVALLAGYYILPANERRLDEKFDYAGAGLFAVGMTAFLLAVSHGEEWGWRSAAVIALAATSVLALGAFVRHEKRTLFPMIDFSLFRKWAFLSGNITGLLSFMAVFSNTMLLPFYLSRILNLESSHIGLLMTPFPIVLAFVAPVSGYLSERVNPALLCAAGLSVTAAGLVWLATLTAAAAVWKVALGQAVLGLGNGLFQSPNNNSVMSAAPPEKLGLAGGINSLVRNVGQVCGIAIAVSILETRQAASLAGIASPTTGQQIGAFLTGYHTALGVGAVFAVLGAVVSFRRRSHLKPAEK